MESGELEEKKRLLVELKASIDTADARFEQIEHEIRELTARRSDEHRKWQALMVEVRADVMRLHGIDTLFRSCDPGGEANDWLKGQKRRH